MPLIDEHVRAVGRDVGEYARLHWELAQEEARDGSKRIVSSLFLLAFGVTAGALVLVAAGVALFFLLRRAFSPAAAAALVAVAYGVVTVAVCAAGWWRLRGARALFLPQTRAMLWEWITCRDAATGSSASSEPAEPR